MKNLFHVFVLLAAVLPVSYARAEIKVPAKYRCSSETTIRALLDHHFNDGKFEYAVVRLDGSDLLSRLNNKRALTFPLVAPKGKILNLAAKGQAFSMRDPELTQGTVYNSVTETQNVSLGSGLSYKFGCSSKQVEEGKSWHCGLLTFLASDGSQFEGIFASEQLGITVVESAESLLLNMRRESVNLPDKCAVVYNTRSMPYFNIDGDFGENSQTQVRRKAIKSQAIKERTYKIHLDGTSEFLAVNEDNWWIRMESIIGGVNFSYALLEPATGRKFKIMLRPRTLSVWNNGFGPSETDPELLVAFINDRSYRQNVGQEKNELFYFFVGYDLDGGTGGIAGSICLHSDFDGFGDDVEFQHTRALGQQIPDADGLYQFGTFWGRVVVATHEIGHVLGGRHEHGALNQCAGGNLPRLCGTTVMLSGRAGGVDPDARKNFFSKRNDNNIVACMRHADDL